MKYLIYSFMLLLSINTVKAQDVFSYARANQVTELSGFKPEVNAVNDQGFTPLVLAVYNNSYDAAKWLLENGAQPDLKDRSGNTALMGAAFKGHYEMADLLLSYKAGIDVQNHNGATALIFASTFGRNNMVKLFLEHKADKNIKDNRGNSALNHAIMQNNEEGIRLLE